MRYSSPTGPNAMSLVNVRALIWSSMPLSALLTG